MATTRRVVRSEPCSLLPPITDDVGGLAVERSTRPGDLVGEVTLALGRS